MDSKAEAEARASIRGDFLRRLFAVAISVGFATTLVRMPWVQSFSAPTSDEWKQLVVLCVGLFATVASWDGYLLSITKKPLRSVGRYGIDILLVFIYMLFLILSGHHRVWPWLLAVIFALYTIWDALSVREHVSYY